MELTYEKFVPVFKALADETRLKVIDMLSCGELCACDLLDDLDISQSTLSYHMKILTDCNLVKSRKDGQWVRYSLENDKFEESLKFLQALYGEKEDCICRKGRK